MIIAGTCCNSLKNGNDFNKEMLEIAKTHFIRGVLKFVKMNIQTCWVHDNSQNKVMEGVGFLIETSFKYCVLHTSFFKKSDSLIQNQCFERPCDVRDRDE